MIVCYFLGSDLLTSRNKISLTRLITHDQGLAIIHIPVHVPPPLEVDLQCRSNLQVIKVRLMKENS